MTKFAEIDERMDIDKRENIDDKENINDREKREAVLWESIDILLDSIL
jgi:hypothetical protein